MDLFEEMRAIVAALDAASVDYAICGGVALAIHGFPRATKDIDILVPTKHIDAMRPVVRACGYDLEALPMTFSSSGITIHRFTKVESSTRMTLTLDVLEATGPLDRVWETRERVLYEGGSVAVVSREGLITLKLAAGRPQDIVDVQRLKEANEGEPK